MKKSNVKPSTKIGRQVTQKSFTELTNEFAYPIATWQHKKPAKRNAFLLFCDQDAGEFHAFLLGNNRAKYPTATALNGLMEAMRSKPELYNWIRASVRCIEREDKKAAKEQK